jgi:predicted O-linked N-acetylglucosamine transferase (SPINDLY family)/SAM-dependent methyltransferase
MKTKQRPRAIQPNHLPGAGAEAQAMDHLKAGRFKEAAVLFRDVIAEDPQHWRSLHLLGLIAHRQGQHVEAAQLIRQAIHIRPDLAEAHSDLGVVLKELGELDDARGACEKATHLKPAFPPGYSNLGNIFKAQGRLEDAVTHYRKALALEPGFADALINLANTLILMERLDEALPAAEKAVKLAPLHAEAHVVLGHALRKSGRSEDAMKAYFHALELRPEYGPVYSDLGCLLSEEGQHEDAIQAHERALQFSPSYAEAHNNLGISLRALGRNLEALQHYKHAVALKPEYPEAYSNMGTVLDLLGRHEEAVDAYRRAVALKPDLAVAYVNLAGSLWEQGKIAEAIAAYSYSLSVNPEQPNALVDLYNLRRHACDWRDLAAQEEKILSSTYRRGKRVPPFPLLNVHGAPAEEQLCAREWAKGIATNSQITFDYARLPAASNPRRLRIGYLSADFCRHATAALVSELIEIHDRERFEIFGYAYGRDDKSEMRDRLAAAFDTFVDIHALPHAEAARRIHGDEIDILIDLKGYTTHARTEILAHRPAPIQVNYLGYPGTMGAPFIDYLIADRYILPASAQAFFDEKIVYLPNSYQPNDTKRSIAPTAPTRSACGLPETAFVFCSFNNTYKITPELFDIWMRLLGAVPGSVLWLLEANALVKENLSREAAARGIDSGRLVFAPKMELPQHLARHAQADLFLDTLPVNAHTTASDALWAGLPVLTCAGKSFASRVAGSLLHAVGLPELATESLADYETLALRLAQNPAALAALRKRLEQNRNTAPLFNIARYTRDLEAAFEHMAEIAVAGEVPKTFAVGEIERASKYPIALKPKAAAAPAAKAPPAPTPALSKAPRILYKACPLCDSKEIAHVKEADCSHHPSYQPSLPPTMAWCRCAHCGHVFTEGYFTPEAAAIIFSKTLPHQALGHDVENQRVVSARMIERVARYAPSGDWLDIGFGNGSLLFTAEEWGYKPVGVDLRAENVEALKKIGYEAHCTPVEQLPFSGRFSVISMADVLEHIPYPKPALEAAHRLMKDGGVLFVSMPNMQTMIWRAMDSAEANPYWGEIEHYHNFSRSRLYALLDKHGFTPLQYGISERYRACMEVIAARR